MSAHGDDPKVHRIEVERDEEGPTSVRFVCDADSAAPCHQYADCACEQWSDDLHGDPPAEGHESVQQSECWIDPWLNSVTDYVSDFVELYDGDTEGHAVSHPDGATYDDLSWLTPGPISVAFDGDCVLWEYAS